MESSVRTLIGRYAALFWDFDGVIKELGPEIPVVLQDYPQTTNVYFSPTLLNRLFNDFPTIKMMKHEEAPGLRKISKIRAAETSGEEGSRPSARTADARTRASGSCVPATSASRAASALPHAELRNALTLGLVERAG